jgi:hypothetical protein
MPTTQAIDQLRCDIAILRAILDAAVAANASELVDAVGDLLHERREQLDAAEAAAVRRRFFRAA